MGANRWHNEESWPPGGVLPTDYFFHSRGAANTPAVDGALSLEPPEEEPPDRFDYDPRYPVMSLCTPDVQDTASDQRPLDHRRDVLVYQTAPLTADMEICGDVVVKLFAASSAPDTDFTAKLVDVHPDGLAVGLCYGIDISSSNFPFFDRNHNTGRPFYADADLAVASQAVYHTVMYPSGVVLPILPGDGNNV